MHSTKFSVFILTMFPQMFPGTLQYSVAGQALNRGVWQYKLIDIRQFGLTKHKNIDDAPYGGGAGMVMRPDVVASAIDNALNLVLNQALNQNKQLNQTNDSQNNIPKFLIIYMSPRGQPLTQQLARDLANQQNLIILCGRFEGVDERLIEAYNIKEISIGDYILSGGELAAMILLDSCIRLLPTVMQNPATLEEESFSRFGPDNNVLLEYPLYTRPLEWRGRHVPSVLLSGNHQEIAKWRHAESIKITQTRRPDLLK